MGVEVTVYVVNLSTGIANIKRVRAVAKTRKWTWATEKNGRRHLVGASAFYTLASACRVRLAILLRTATDSYIRFQHPMLRGKADSEVRAWQKHGVEGWKIKDYT